MAQSREILEQLLQEDPTHLLADGRPEIRRLAIVALGHLGSGGIGPLAEALDSDDHEEVRAEAAEALGRLGTDAYDALMAAMADPSSRVVEAAISSLGELADPRPLPLLIEVAGGEADPLVREAAVAALGAIGDRRALPALLELARSGRPQLRRRAIVALTAFDGPDVEAALGAARLDRNPMVREVAEMVLGRPAASRLQPSASSHQREGDEPQGSPPTNRS